MDISEDEEWRAVTAGDKCEKENLVSLNNTCLEVYQDWDLISRQR